MMVDTTEWKQPDVAAPLDQWATWLIAQRFTQRSPEERQAALALLQSIRDRVLHGANIRTGATILDLGAGTGLLAIGALATVGATGHVIAADISLDSLRTCKADTAKLPITYSLDAVVTDGVQLAIAQQTCDAVVIRSVLIYVADKETLLQECYRVLRPGGRLSLFEPINRERSHTLDLKGLPLALQEKLRRIDEERLNGSARSASTNVRADDLVRMVSAVGFSAVECARDLVSETLNDVLAVERYFARVPAPGQPSPAAFYQQYLTPEEWQVYYAYWTASVQQMPISFRTPVVYITARK
jgi:ubiquinone/menaquinone biosynthesis C-methylase UbiE